MNDNIERTFNDVTAQIVYEFIDPSTGQWTLHTQQVKPRGNGYAAVVRDTYLYIRQEQEGRQDRRHLHVEVRPDAPGWVEVPTDDSNLADIEGTMYACRNATWSLASIPS